MEIISDSMSISDLQVLKPSVTDANLEMVVPGFWWIFKSSDRGSRMARHVMKSHVEELCIWAGQGAKRLWGRVTKHHLCGTSRLQMRNGNSRRRLLPFLPPFVLRMDTCNWKKPSPLPQWESLLHSVCFMFVPKKKSAGSLITCKDTVWMWNLWHTLANIWP